MAQRDHDAGQDVDPAVGQHRGEVPFLDEGDHLGEGVGPLGPVHHVRPVVELAGVEEGCVAEVLVLAAALNIQDPRERPRGIEQKADQLEHNGRSAEEITKYVEAAIRHLLESERTLPPQPCPTSVYATQVPVLTLQQENREYEKQQNSMAARGRQTPNPQRFGLQPSS